MSIKILREGLPVIGFAKIGEPSPKNSRLRGAPVKFDHIEITGLARDRDNRLIPDRYQIDRVLEQGALTCGGCDRSKELGYPNGLPVEMGVMLQSNSLDVVLPNRLAWYRSRTAFCVGDGESAERLTITGEKEIPGRQGEAPRMVTVYGPAQPHRPCGFDCPDLQERRCKPNGKFRFVLATQQTVGGVYEFRTTSWGSIANLRNALREIALTTGGVIAWVPLMFRIRRATVQSREGIASQAMLATVEPPSGGPDALLRAAAEVLRLRAPLMKEVRMLDTELQRAEQWGESPEEIADWRAEYAMGTPDTGAHGLARPERIGAPADAESAPQEPEMPQDEEIPPDASQAPAEEPDLGAQDASQEGGGVPHRVAPDSPVIEEGQWRLLRAKAQYRAERLGFEGSNAGDTVLADVCERHLGISPKEDLRVSEMEAVIAALDAYTGAGG